MKPHERRRRNQSSTVAHRKKRRAAGVPERGARVRATPKPGSVPREPFVRWLQEKLATPGMTLTQLADRTGIGQRNLHRFLLGYDKGGIVAGSKSQYKRRNKYRPIDWVTFETVDNAVAMYGEPWVINDLYPAEEYHPETD